MALKIELSGQEEQQVMAEINTTPLVDIMLVLLIIFLITIPIITKTVPVRLPKAVNIATKTKPENIVISVDVNGGIWWNGVLMADRDALIKRVVVEAVKVPQPEVHIRGDSGVRYEAIGRTLYSIQRGGLT
jgi:biopolymer transport protein ExbD